MYSHFVYYQFRIVTFRHYNMYFYIRLHIIIYRRSISGIYFIISFVNLCENVVFRILSSTGEVLAYSGQDENKFVDVISAITSNMWLMLQNTGEAALNEDHLNFILIKGSVRINCMVVIASTGTWLRTF